jgi:hypothetical protein
VRSEREKRGVHWRRTTVAESSSTSESEPKASRAGLCAETAAYAETAHSTSIQRRVMIWSQRMAGRAGAQVEAGACMEVV